MPLALQRIVKHGPMSGKNGAICERGGQICQLIQKGPLNIKFNHSIYNGTPGTASFNALSQKFESFIVDGCTSQIDTIVKVIN